MKRIILIKYGEIILKGLNRGAFERMLLTNIRHALSAYQFKMHLKQATIYLEPDDQDELEEMMEKVAKVFGIIWIIPCIVCDKDIDKMCEVAFENTKDIVANHSFKIESKRADKKFPLTSQEISREVGGYIFEHAANVTVDVHHPDIMVYVEVREDDAYIYYERKKGQGGLPTGSSSTAALLLSGGIDSPVAGYMMAKRGVELHAINFFSYPYTSERAKEKVLELARLLSEFTGKIVMHIVPFTEIQLAIRDNCPEEHLTLIMRRFMMKISDEIAYKNHCKSLITGESLGQVASQTMEALHVTNSVVNHMPVFRPLIGMDKTEIISISERIGTYKTSILPYEDCCTVFTPKHPTTKPKIEKIIASEAVLDIDTMIQTAIEGTEDIVITPSYEI